MVLHTAASTQNPAYHIPILTNIAKQMVITSSTGWTVHSDRENAQSNKGHIVRVEPYDYFWVETTMRIQYSSNIVSYYWTTPPMNGGRLRESDTEAPRGGRCKTVLLTI